MKNELKGMTDKEVSEALSGYGSRVYEPDSYAGPKQFGSERPKGPEIPFVLLQRFPTRLIAIHLLVTVDGPHVEAVTVMGVEISTRQTKHHRFDEAKSVWTPKGTRIPRGVRAAIEDMFHNRWMLFTVGYSSELQSMITGVKGERAGYRLPSQKTAVHGTQVLQ